MPPTTTANPSIPEAPATEFSDIAVRVVRGDQLDSKGRHAAIDVLYQGFRRKLHKLLLISGCRRQIKRVLPQVIDFSQSLVALQCHGDDGERVCGVLLMNLGGKDYLRFDWRVARREFGLWGAAYRRLNYWVVNGKRRDAGELNIQALAVRRGARCRGVGTELLHAAEAYAQEQGYERVSLEVVDTNPRAKALYERQGYTQEHTSTTWPYTARAGFRRSDYLVKRLTKHETAKPKPR